VTTRGKQENCGGALDAIVVVSVVVVVDWKVVVVVDGIVTWHVDPAACLACTASTTGTAVTLVEGVMTALAAAGKVLEAVAESADRCSVNKQSLPSSSVSLMESVHEVVGQVNDGAPSPSCGSL